MARIRAHTFMVTDGDDSDVVSIVTNDEGSRERKRAQRSTQKKLKRRIRLFSLSIWRGKQQVVEHPRKSERGERVSKQGESE